MRWIPVDILTEETQIFYGIIKLSQYVALRPAWLTQIIHVYKKIRHIAYCKYNNL